MRGEHRQREGVEQLLVVDPEASLPLAMAVVLFPFHDQLRVARLVVAVVRAVVLLFQT